MSFPLRRDELCPRQVSERRWLSFKHAPARGCPYDSRSSETAAAIVAGVAQVACCVVRRTRRLPLSWYTSWRDFSLFVPSARGAEGGASCGGFHFPGRQRRGIGVLSRTIGVRGEREDVLYSVPACVTRKPQALSVPPEPWSSALCPQRSGMFSRCRREGKEKCQAERESGPAGHRK